MCVYSKKPLIFIFLKGFSWKPSNRTNVGFEHGKKNRLNTGQRSLKVLSLKNYCPCKTSSTLRHATYTKEACRRSVGNWILGVKAVCIIFCCLARTTLYWATEGMEWNKAFSKQTQATSCWLERAGARIYTQNFDCKLKLVCSWLDHESDALAV